MDVTTRAVLDLLHVAQSALGTRPLAVGPLEPYAQSVDHIVGHALEYASALLGDLSNDNDPFLEFGKEPLTHAEALELAPTFIQSCCNILAGEPPFPLACMSIRAQTFACVLLSSSEKDASAS